jgi:hypothetical protein
LRHLRVAFVFLVPDKCQKAGPERTAANCP